MTDFIKDTPIVLPAVAREKGKTTRVGGLTVFERLKAFQAKHGDEALVAMCAENGITIPKGIKIKQVNERSN